MSSKPISPEPKIGPFVSLLKVSLKGAKLPEGVNEEALAKYN